MIEREHELRELMLRGRAGDGRATDRFLTLLAAALRGYLRRQLVRHGRADPTAAEDLVQETLIAVHVKRHTYDASVPVTAWVHAIARYKLVDHLRATRRLAGQVVLDDVEGLLAAEDHEAASTARDLDQLLALLPARTRRLIEATKLEGRSVKEAADEAGLSETAAKVAVHRGLKRLSALFGRG